MLNLHFICPKCQKTYTIRGWLWWILTTPFHWFSKRYTKCPHCETRSWVAWQVATRDERLF